MSEYTLSLQKVSAGFILKAHGHDVPRREFASWDEVVPYLKGVLKMEEGEVQWLQTELGRSNFGISPFRSRRTVTREVVDALQLK